MLLASAEPGWAVEQVSSEAEAVSELCLSWLLPSWVGAPEMAA